LKVCSSSTSKTQKLKQKKKNSSWGGFCIKHKLLVNTPFACCWIPYDNMVPNFWSYNRVFSKVKKTRHQNPEFGPEFGPKLGEIFFLNLQKSTLPFKAGSNSDILD